MMKFLSVALISTALLAKVPPAPICPQIDIKHLDTDGIPLCPCEVKGEESAWAVFKCAVEQATSFHAPTADEKTHMTSMLEAWQTGKPAELMAAADALELQVCRVKQFKEAQPDSYLLVYVKPGITDYSGPFFMLRETRKSRILIIGPHDDSDSTQYDTKLALSESFAMATISNGHLRGKVRTLNDPRGYADFVHTPGGADADLGTFAVQKVCELNRSSVVVHVHGMKDQTKMLYRARNDILEKAWEDAVTANTFVKNFANLNAYFTIDPLINTNWYVKAEFPSTIHRQDKLALARIVLSLEKNSWAW